MKEKINNNNKIKSLLRYRSLKGKPSLSEVLNSVDIWAKQIAKGIGNILLENPDWQNLGWFFTQYRGTIISGERDFEDFFSRDDLGSKLENENLLHVYWYTYGLGSTIGEIFEAKCLSDETKCLSDETNNISKDVYRYPYWQLLKVDLIDGQTGGAHDDILNFKSECLDEEYIQQEKQNICVKVRHMSIGRNLIDIILPPEALQEALKLIRWHKHLRYDHARSVPPEFVSLLSSAIHKEIAEIVWRRHFVTKDDLFAETNEFICGTRDQSTFTEEHMLYELLRALQMLGLYWKWIETVKKQSFSGSLVVCIPRPARNEKGMGLQPRLGFATMFINGENNSLNLCKNLIFDWQSAIDSVGSEICTHRGNNIAGNVNSFGIKLFGNNANQHLLHLIKKLAFFHPGGKIGANLLLQRLLPVIGKVNQLSSNYIHEGRRFKVDILIGLPYHEQIIGKPIGSIEKYIADFEVKVPYVTRRTKPQPSWSAIDLMEPLIHSCYSLLDWDNVVLFAKFDPEDEEGRGIRFTSLRRLKGQTGKTTLTEIYTNLTKQHAGLFAVTVDRGGAIRVYYGGDFMLSKYNDEWKTGSAEDELKINLVRTLECNKLKKEGDSYQCLSQFVRILLRISEEPGEGAAFVIFNDSDNEDIQENMLSKISPPPEPLWEKIRPFSQVFSERDNEIFYRLAIMDGAMGIILGQGETFEQRWHSAKICPRLLMTQRFDINDFWDKEWQKGNWSEWLKSLSFGSRHSSGLALSMIAKRRGKSVAVILVSADGPITFMVGGRDPVKTWPSNYTQTTIKDMNVDKLT